MRKHRLVALCALLAACGGGMNQDDGGRQSGGADVEQRSTPVSCPGLAADRDQRSGSYLPGAPALTEDGDEVTLLLSVRVPQAGGCSPAQGELVEIWHTGTDGYQPDRWRTALRTDSRGEISYKTVRPSDEEGFPHYHVRITRTDGTSYEWVLGVDESTTQTLTVGLVLSYQDEPGGEAPSQQPQV